jgi:thiamine phosphate synthase YjbQ (UPF0047 family)
MSTDPTERDERPCLHCLLVDVIDQYFDEYTAREDNTVDTGEVIVAVAKTIAEMTASQDKSGRQETIERLMREIMNYDGEYRQHDAMGVGSDARH